MHDANATRRDPVYINSHIERFRVGFRNYVAKNCSERSSQDLAKMFTKTRLPQNHSSIELP